MEKTAIELFAGVGGFAKANCQRRVLFFAFLA